MFKVHELFKGRDAGGPQENTVTARHEGKDGVTPWVRFIQSTPSTN